MKRPKPSALALYLQKDQAKYTAKDTLVMFQNLLKTKKERIQITLICLSYFPPLAH